MSVCNIFVKPDRCYMMTDSSLYDQAGKIVGFQNKTRTASGFAISFRGQTYGINIALQISYTYADFDQFIENSGVEIESEFEAFKESTKLSGRPCLDLYAIGWSEINDCPQAFVLSDYYEHSYTWQKIGGYGLGPDIGSVGHHRLHREGLEIDVDYTIDEFDPIKHGLPIVEVQRRQKTDPKFLPEGIEPFYCIGGQIWLTEVDRDGVTQRVIRTYSDNIGEPINPDELDNAKLSDVAPSWIKGEADAALWLALNKAGGIDPTTLLPRAGFVMPRSVSLPRKKSVLSQTELDKKRRKSKAASRSRKAQRRK